MREKNDDLDLLPDVLIDAALATYADPGPDSGLDRRVMARISEARIAAEPAPRRRWLPWAIALPAAACLLLFLLVLSGPKQLHPPSSNPEQANQSQEAPIAVARTAPSTAPQALPAHGTKAPGHGPRSRATALAAKPAPLPKLDVFPTPRPLTPEEQALVEFAAHATKAERESFFAAQQQADEPLQIVAIQIPPLEPPAPGTN
ncbi:MAG: hypothetical protein KGL37_12590 [Acidobacteriota bacterium]|nr:hypothetical protein [Acidobacteriota bacterium]